MKRTIKVFAIVMAVCVSLFVSLSAGFLLAVLENGSELSEVFKTLSGEYLKEIDNGNVIKVKTDNGESGEGQMSVSNLVEAPIEKNVVYQYNDNVTITPEIAGIKNIVRASDGTVLVSNEEPDTTGAVISADVTVTDPLSDYPRPFTEVDLSYFDDALFIGDSRVAGLGMYSGTNATFYAVTSFQLYKYKTTKMVQTPEGKVPMFDAMPYNVFKKIYIKVGLNELGISDSAFIEHYQNLLNDLRVMQPEAIIYIHAVLPVTKKKSDSDPRVNNTNIARRNAVLRDFAQANMCYFVEASPDILDEEGNLKAETTSDGIHMSGKYMPIWVDYLRRHAVVIN